MCSLKLQSDSEPQICKKQRGCLCVVSHSSDLLEQVHPCIKLLLHAESVTRPACSMLLKLCYGILFIDILIVEYTQQQQTPLSSFGHRILLDLNNTAYLSTLFIGAVLGGKGEKERKENTNIIAKVQPNC